MFNFSKYLAKRGEVLTVEVRTTEAYLSSSIKVPIAPGSQCLTRDPQGYQCMPPFVSMLSTDSTRSAMSYLATDNTLAQLLCDSPLLAIHYEVTASLGVTRVGLEIILAFYAYK